jgi:AcrR family transcriptional regulator
LTVVIVKKLGRPSKAAERRASILRATAAVVAREGLDQATVAKVADEAGLQRTLVFHYFGDRRALLDAFVSEIVALYGDLQILGDPSRGIGERLDRAFEPGHYASRDDLVVWSELAALAARDAKMRERLQALWRDRWLPMIERELASARPRATSTQIGAVAHGIACLVEAHWSLHLQGIDSARTLRHSKKCGRILLDSLPA